MKHILIYLSLVFSATLFISSCTKSCEKVVCGFNEQCAQGKCYCNDGFEGDSCNILAYTKYEGTFLVSEICQGTQSPFGPQYQVFVTKGNNNATIVISGFLGQGINLTAIIRTDQANRGNTLEIPRQNHGGITGIEGFGTYNPVMGANGRFSIELNYSISGVPYSCRQVFFPN